MECYFVDGPILLVGEGNFSFSLSLIKKLTKPSFVMTSCLESDSNLSTNARHNVDRLKKLGYEVYFEVDATKLHHQNQFHSKYFSNIIFNFPHAGRKNNIKLNRELLREFFTSAEKVLEKNGKIFVSLCQGQGGIGTHREWSDTWQVVAMANYANMILNEVLPFDSNHYPEYISSGYRNNDKTFCTDGALTYIFVKSPEITLSENPVLFYPITINNSKLFIPSYIMEHLKGISFKKRDNAVTMIRQELLKNIRTHWEVKVLPSSVSLKEFFCNFTKVSLMDVIFGRELNNQNVAEFSLDDFELMEIDTKNENCENDDVRIAGFCGDANNDDLLRRKIYGVLSNSGGGTIKSDQILIKYDLSFRNVISEETPSIDYVLIGISPEDVSVILEKIIKIFEELLKYNHTCIFATEKVELFDCDSRIRLILRPKSKGKDNSKTETECYEKSHDRLHFCSCSHGRILSKSLTKYVFKTICIGDIYAVIYENKKYTAFILDMVQITRVCCHLSDWRMVLNPTNETIVCKVHGFVSKCWSLFPPMHVHDVSFWGSEKFSEERFLFYLRNALGDVIKDVQLLDRHVAPSTGDVSYCYRLVYQSHHRCLSKAQCCAIQLKLRKHLENTFRLNLR